MALDCRNCLYAKTFSFYETHEDYVKVVRCKDCKYVKNMAPIGESDYEIGECTMREEDDVVFMVYDDDYCSYGERKDND